MSAVDDSFNVDRNITGNWTFDSSFTLILADTAGQDAGSVVYFEGDSILYFKQAHSGRRDEWVSLFHTLAHNVGEARDSTATLALTQNVKTLITNSHGTLLNKIETEGIIWRGDSLQIVRAGDYELFFSISSTGTADDDIVIYVNAGGVVAYKIPYNITKTGGSGGAGARSFTKYLAGLSKNDIVSFEVTNTKNNNDIVITDMEVYLRWDHD